MPCTVTVDVIELAPVEVIQRVSRAYARRGGSVKGSAVAGARSACSLSGVFMDTRTAAPTSFDASAAPAGDPLEETLRAALAPRMVVLRLVGAGGMARVYLACRSAPK